MEIRRPTDEAPPSAVDQRIRRTLEPAPGAAARVVRRALEAERARLALLPIAATLTAAAALALFLIAPRPPERGGLDRRRPPHTITISNRGGLVTIESPTGDTWVLLPGGTR
jgi:hypothetical protein